MKKICIKGTDYSYFEELVRRLDGLRQVKLLKAVRKMAGEKAVDKNQKIQIIPDDVYLGQLAVPENKFISRTMIKKAYKAVKEENPV
ncbi:MAG: hypothetical protein WC539_04205 [Nitrospirota bacterium]